MIPTIAVSMGDPGGIGPEVLVKALGDTTLRARARWVVHGLQTPMTLAARAAGIEPYWSLHASSGPPPGIPGVVLVDHEQLAGPGPWPAHDDSRAGAASLAFLNAAIADAQRPGPERARAIVTGPISKAAWALAGERRFHGHTELLAHRFGDAPHAMMFASPVLNVILVTAHVPLARVPGLLNPQHIARTIRLGHDAMRTLAGSSPRIAVCGVNPHAGESGLLGDEDARLIAPAIESAKREGIDASGPFPADTIFLRALSGSARRFDLVVAMYHDQGLIPLKLLARDTAVNMTVGLPVPRTSPDHGTAFDIAGRNLADPGSMRAACEMAVRLA